MARDQGELADVRPDIEHGRAAKRAQAIGMLDGGGNSVCESGSITPDRDETRCLAEFPERLVNTPARHPTIGGTVEGHWSSNPAVRKRSIAARSANLLRYVA